MSAQNVITVNPFPIPDCRVKGNTAYLDIYWDGDWVDQNGLFHAASPLRSLERFTQRINLTISALQLSCPSFQIYSTLNALVNNSVVATGIIRDQNEVYIKTLFEQWFFPYSTLAYNFSDLEILNLGRALFLPPSTYLDAAGVQALIDSEILKLFAAGSALTGSGFLTIGLPTTIFSPTVTVNSPILATSSSDSITGKLSATNRVAGVSFDIASDNFADTGNFKWLQW